MFSTDPVSIKEDLQDACGKLADSKAPEEHRIAASMRIRRLTQVIFLNVTVEDWNRAEMQAMLDEADLSVDAMNTYQDVVEKEAERHHQPGTTAKIIIDACRKRIFSVRQESEIFTRTT